MEDLPVDVAPPPSSSGASSLNEEPQEHWIEAASLLAHVQTLESKLPPDETQFGHPEPPQLVLCRIPAKEEGISALMAFTKRCVSAQLIKEVQGKPATVGTPAEVLVLQGTDQISCATVLALENPRWSAPDNLIVPDRSHTQQGLSLMSGGMVHIAPSPRVAVVVGTQHSRVISVEFSVKAKSLLLTRRKYYVDNQVLTYYEPLPYARVTDFQRSHQQGVTGTNGEPPRRIVPLEPSQGVSTIQPYGRVVDGKAVTYLWISFGDGTAVRLHHAAFFASVIQKHTESQPNPQSLEEKLGETVVRWEAKLPPIVNEHSKAVFSVVPVPNYHPSPMAPFPIWKKTEFDEEASGVMEETKEQFEALVYCTGAPLEAFPTLVFYTSEDQFERRTQHPEEDEEAENGSGGIITTVIGGIFGMFGSTSTTPQEEPAEESTPVPQTTEKWDPTVPFPSLNLDPYKLFAGSELYDPPRQITQCTVDPEGNLAALADTLGRVSLVDLSTKQIVRMWKGLRDTTCSWLEIPRNTLVGPGQKVKTLYLVIHSRQRKVVEVWRTRHGPKVLSKPVPRDAQIIPVRELSVVGYVACCYLAHSNVPFSKRNHLEKLTVQEDETAGTTTAERNRPIHPKFTMVPTDDATRLNRLKQLLSDTNVECQSVDVFKALERIRSVQDLGVALDTLAQSPTLERKMGVEGSTFQRLALSFCKGKLDEAVSEAGKEAFTNPHVQFLAFKIAYYTQVSKAYDVIYRHELNDEAEPPVAGVSSPSSWGLEAIGWTAVYEKVTHRQIDEGIPEKTTDPMKFYEFASALEPPKEYMEEDFVMENGGYKIYFSDSTKTRREILVRIFKPLLGDVFSFGAVSQIFDALGTKADDEYLMQCFGEWFSCLSIKELTKKAIFIEDSPVKRWLQERIKTQLESENSKSAPMESIFQYCLRSEELVRGFWLATLCQECMDHVSKDMESKTYGKVSSDELVERWNGLLRQLRVCLLVSLRLNGIVLGPLPLSVFEVEKGQEFSVFQWLAHDELLVSHKHDEIVSLEQACKMSTHSFDASSPETDDPTRWKDLQRSCLSIAMTDDERAEYLVDHGDGESIGALLLYLQQYNMGEILVAHRALLLAAKWGKDPKDLEILEDAVVAMQALDVKDHKRIASAVRLEIWQTRIRPMYRALLFGLEDVQEVSPEVVEPLFQDAEWVTKFSEITSKLLDVLNDIEWQEDEVVNLHEDYIEAVDTDSWPNLTECPILAKLVYKNKKIRSSAFDAHKMLMTALKITQDIPKLSTCIPSFYDLFMPGSLFHKTVPAPDAEENQQALMQDAVVAHAKNFHGPSMDTFDLGDIGTLSDLFDFEMDNIRTLFLLAMYEYGKDGMVDDIITRSGNSISVAHFCDGGVEIVCRRLDYLLHVEPTEEIKGIMGTLDANMCEWVNEKAVNSEALVGDEELAVPPGNTHLFALRLLSLGANADIEKSERIKIHSLVVLSGSIVKGLEALHPHENRSVQLPPMDISLPSKPDESVYKSEDDSTFQPEDPIPQGNDSGNKAVDDPWRIFSSGPNDDNDDKVEPATMADDVDKQSSGSDSAEAGFNFDATDDQDEDVFEDPMSTETMEAEIGSENANMNEDGRSGISGSGNNNALNELLDDESEDSYGFADTSSDMAGNIDASSSEDDSMQS